MKKAIEFINVTKRFGNFCANNQISFSVLDNEVHALLGENGAGKSTLMNILFGIYEKDAGEIKINGEVVNITNPKQANQLKIGMVHQHFQLVDTFSVAQNVVLGNEATKGGIIDQKNIDQQVQAIIDQYHFDLKATDKICNLTVGQQQKVEILKMLFNDAKYLIFDEPTGALTPQETEDFLGIVKDLQAQGKTIIIITHKLHEIKAVANRCTIIRKGKTIKTVDVPSTSSIELASLMVGYDVDFNLDKPQVTPGEVKLQLVDLCVGDKVKNVNLELHAGEILAIAGVDGNGQSELVEAIIGLRKASSGQIIINGEDVSNKSIRYRNEQHIGYVPQDRQKFGLVLDYDIAQNSVLKKYFKKPFCKGGILQNKAINEYGQQLIENFDIRCNDGVDSSARSLSGGNQQKLIIAREFCADPDILILVQPTRGVDVGAISNIHQNILKQLELGKAILLVSLELDEVMQLSNRISVIHDGEIMGTTLTASATEQEIGLMMAGMRGNHE